MILLSTILQYGIDLNLPDPALKRNPVHFAVLAGRNESVQFLLDQGADPLHPDIDGFTASHFAFMLRDSSIPGFVSRLESIDDRVKDDPDCNLLKPPIWINSPLEAAADSGNEMLVQEILNHPKATLDRVSIQRALYFAVAGNWARICNQLLNFARSSRLTLSNPMSMVSASTLYQQMMRHGLNYELAFESTIESLLSYGLSIDGLGMLDDSSLLNSAVQNLVDRPELFSIVLKYNPSTNIGARQTPILFRSILAVSESQNPGCVPLLIAHGVDTSQTMDYIAASESQDPDYVTHFVSNGIGTTFDLRRRAIQPIHMACIQNAFGAGKALISHSKTLLEERTSWGETPLHVACTKNSPAMVDLLLEHGADITAPDDQGQTPFELAVLFKCTGVFSAFLRGRASIWNTHQKPPRPLLYFSIGYKGSDRTRISRQLLSYPQMRQKEIVNWTNDLGFSMLSMAIIFQHDSLAIDSIEAGAEMGKPHGERQPWAQLTEDVARIRSYRYNVPEQRNQYHKVLRIFAQHFRNEFLLESCNFDSETPLHIACFHRNIGAVSVLLEEGADPHARNVEGQTPLLSCLSGPIAQRLNKFNFGSWEDDVWSEAWEQTAEEEIQQIAALLTAHGGSVDATDNDGMTALKYAIITPFLSEHLVLFLLGKSHIYGTIQAFHLENSDPVLVCPCIPRLLRAALAPKKWAQETELWDTAAKNCQQDLNVRLERKARAIACALGVQERELGGLEWLNGELVPIEMTCHED